MPHATAQIRRGDTHLDASSSARRDFRPTGPHHAPHAIAVRPQKAYRFAVRDFEITHLYISPGHNFFGHDRGQPSSNPDLEVPSLWCVAGKGIEGDRFFDYKESYKGQITFFEEETYDDLCAQFGIFDRPPSVFRRNVITRGVRLNDLIGHEFTIDDVCLLGTEESRPCFWMDHAFGPGAQAALKGRGGLRARILTSGRLVVRNRERGEGRAVGMSSRSSVEALGDKTSPNSHADERSSSLASIIDSCRPAPDLGPHG